MSDVIEKALLELDSLHRCVRITSPLSLMPNNLKNRREGFERFGRECATLLPEAIKEIKRVTAERDELFNQKDSLLFSIECLERRGAEFLARAEAAEAKLAVAVEDAFKEGWNEALWGGWLTGADHSAWLKSAALAEIKGGAT